MKMKMNMRMINMKQAKPLLGTVITLEIVDNTADQQALDKVFSYFNYVEERFSVFKPESEISLINQNKIKSENYSADMKTVFRLAEQTKEETCGYFNIRANDGKINPSGLVKGWAIYGAAKLLDELGFKNFYVNGGGDIETRGKNNEGRPWSVGIENPFNREQIIKVVYLSNLGIATSGNYLRGQHIYDPFERQKEITEIVSLSVIGPNVYEADRFATAAFAMGKRGIEFIAGLPGFEGYLIDATGQATFTGGFEKYLTE